MGRGVIITGKKGHAMTPKKQPEPEKADEHDEQTITVDGKNRTVAVELRGKDGLVLLKAIAFFVVVSSIAILIYCLGYMIDAIGRNFFESTGLILWLICLCGSVCWSHWPQ